MLVQGKTLHWQSKDEGALHHSSKNLAVICNPAAFWENKALKQDHFGCQVAQPLMEISLPVPCPGGTALNIALIPPVDKQVEEREIVQGVKDSSAPSWMGFLMA